jgi:hypothetical protein
MASARVASARAKVASAPARGARRPALRLVGPGETVEPPRPAARERRSLAELSRRDGKRLLLLTVGLNCFGLVMVLSASSVNSISTAGTPWSLFEKQVMWTVIGAVACFIAVRFDLARLRRLTTPFLVLSGFLLVAVLAPGLGKTVGGSSRWIGAGPIRIQPSELSKIALRSSSPTWSRVASTSARKLATSSGPWRLSSPEWRSSS